MIRATIEVMHALTALGRYAVKIDPVAIAVPDLETAIAFFVASKS